MEYISIAIGIASLCATLYGLGYNRGKQDSKTEK